MFDCSRLFVDYDAVGGEPVRDTVILSEAEPDEGDLVHTCSEDN